MTNNTDNSLAEDEALLTGAVRAAGALALSFFRNGVVGRSKADNTPVSDADLAVDEMLRERLIGERPDYGWLSEESVDNPSRLDAARVWIVDPIDGTRAFLAGTPEWTIAVALVENGQPVLAAVFNPATAEMFTARRGNGAYLNGVPISVTTPEDIAGCRMIATKGFFKHKVWTAPWPHTENTWFNSIAYRLALIAAGRADATLSLTGKSEWDIAAAALLVEEAGGQITDATGAALTYNKPSPRMNGLVAAAPRLHDLLVARTKPVAAKEI
jgi:myo-inositol-1(or 4)-monophosphatase